MSIKGKKHNSNMNQENTYISILMNGNNKKVHSTQISQQLHKNISERGTDIVHQVATVPARGYITYSTRERIDHFGDGQWQTQRRYGSSTEDMPRDYYGPYNNQANYSRKDYRSDDPVFDEFLSSLMKSFDGYGNPNIVGYRTEFALPVGYYNDPYFTNMRNNHSAFTSTAQGRDTYSRPDSPSRRRVTSVNPENGPWFPGRRASGGRYAEHQYAQPRFGPFDPTSQTKFHYPDSSAGINDVHQRIELYDGPGKQRSEFGYKDHHYAPPDPTNQTQIPNTPPPRNSPRPVLSTRFEDGKVPDAGGHGYSPSGEVDYVRNSPNEGYNYSYPPAPMAPRDSLTNPEMETSWDIKVNTRPNTGEKISNMTTGALNFAKKNLYPPPEVANQFQFSNQPNFAEKSYKNGSQYTDPAMQEGNTRPEFSMISSQGKGTAFPEMAKTWLTKQLNTGERNPHNETSDFPQRTHFSTPTSQENGNTLPEFSKSASQGKGNVFPEMAKSWFSKQPNTWEKNPHNETSDFPQPTQFPTPSLEENGNTHPEFSKSASRGKGNAFPEMAKNWFSKQPNTGEKNPHDETLNYFDSSQFPTPASQEIGNTRPELSRSASKGNAHAEMANRWFSKQQNTGKNNPHDDTLNLVDPSQFPAPALQENGKTLPDFSRSGSRGNAEFSRSGSYGNARPEMENSWEITNQPNNGETYSNALVRDSSRRSQAQEIGNGSLEASNGPEITKQPNISEKISNFGALNRKSQYPSFFSRERK